MKKGPGGPYGLCARGSLVVRDTPVGEVAVDSLAIGHVLIGHATVGLEAVVLRTQEGTALLLFSLNVLKDGHCLLPVAPVPVAWLGSICSPFGPNAYPYTTMKLVAVDTELYSRDTKKGPGGPKLSISA